MLLRVIYAVILGILCAPSTARPIIDLGYAQYNRVVDTTTNITAYLGIRYAAAPGTCVQSTPVAPDCRRRPEGLHTTKSMLSGSDGDLHDQSTKSSCSSLSRDLGGLPIPQVWKAYRSPHSQPSSGFTAEGAFVISLDEPGINSLRYLVVAASMYDGGDLIAQSNRGIVVVTIQYSLGVFGFLSGTQVKEKGAFNAGLLGQDFALRWVNQHISKFGGDPSRVTIWGVLASTLVSLPVIKIVSLGIVGAGSVLQHVVANDGNTSPQLFRATITNSTFLPSQYSYNDRIPELLYSEVVAQTNCSMATDSMACLRMVDANTLENANLHIAAAAFYGTFVFVSVVNGLFITQRPTLSLTQGNEALLSVTNQFEGTNFVNQSNTALANATKYALHVFPNFGAARADAVGMAYADLGTPLFQTNAVQGKCVSEVLSIQRLLRSFSHIYLANVLCTPRLSWPFF
ncbi:Carboxylic ester hydrolase [Mycena venus]|uniref:Carboxylic ester hydrolase n=1 Tax=Mycena venus TaxID=2733690 RepID=A0A8H7CGW4_9AGAR|nr:Carboxylic ester hydrolase [Mycena venus]